MMSFGAWSEAKVGTISHGFSRFSASLLELQDFSLDWDILFGLMQSTFCYSMKLIYSFDRFSFHFYQKKVSLKCACNVKAFLLGPRLRSQQSKQNYLATNKALIRCEARSHNLKPDYQFNPLIKNRPFNCWTAHVGALISECLRAIAPYIFDFECNCCSLDKRTASNRRVTMLGTVFMDFIWYMIFCSLGHMGDDGMSLLSYLY